jgi:hypothetical protein
VIDCTYPGERWLPVVGYERFYMVSDFGRVHGIRRKGSRGGILKPRTGKYGHQHVNLFADGVSRSKHVHRIVMDAFVGPLPEGMETRHLDGDATNNALSNLAYGTSAENHLDMIRHGRNRNARKTHCSRNHEFTPENTYTPPGGSGRECRECSRASHARRYQESKRKGAA